MIRFRFKELLADKSFKENRRVTIEEVARETGVHRTTLSKISNKNGYSTTTEVLDSLCEYFGCEISEIAEHIKKDAQT
ncbi:MAG: helix-turn-helix transcriptional regulator [Motiliproteus sp.]